MSSVNVASSSNKALVFQTILSSPGMSEKCKLQLQLSRQGIVLLSHLLESGVGEESNALDKEMLNALPPETRSELKNLQEEMLSKAGLSEFYQKLKLIG